MTRLHEYVKKFDLDIAGGLALLTLAVYVRVAWHDFVNYDDPFIVSMNENIRDGLTLHGLRWAFTTPAEGELDPVVLAVTYAGHSALRAEPGGASHCQCAVAHRFDSTANRRS